ncbi:MAG: hypothetical protein ACPGJS_09755 [Flammeovirgaceae bacterium]
MSLHFLKPILHFSLVSLLFILLIQCQSSNSTEQSGSILANSTLEEKNEYAVAESLSEESIESPTVADSTAKAEFVPKVIYKDWNMFTEGSYGIQYPKGWTAVKGSGNETDLLTLSDPTQANVIILRMLSYLPAKSLKSVCKRFPKELGVDVVKQSYETINGNEACRTRYAYMDEEGNKSTETAYIIDYTNEMVYFYFTLYGDAPELEKMMKTFQKQE